MPAGRPGHSRSRAAPRCSGRTIRPCSGRRDDSRPRGRRTSLPGGRPGPPAARRRRGDSRARRRPRPTWSCGRPGPRPCVSPGATGATRPAGPCRSAARAAPAGLASSTVWHASSAVDQSTGFARLGPGQVDGEADEIDARLGRQPDLRLEDARRAAQEDILLARPIEGDVQVARRLGPGPKAHAVAMALAEGQIGLVIDVEVGPVARPAGH